jgi:hypothetical protein
MKKYLLLVGITMIIVSCAPVSYFQVYKTTSENVKNANDTLFFQDENCKIYYNLWTNYGNIGFIFYNKSDKNLYINLEECFFIMNGSSFDYFQNRIYTHSSQTGVTKSSGSSEQQSSKNIITEGQGSATTGLNFSNLIQTNYYTLSSSGATQYSKSVSNAYSVSVLKGTSIAYNEKKIICIPPQSYKLVKEFNIKTGLYRNCDLLTYPKNSQSLTFSKQNTPLILSNIITYSKNSDCLSPIKVINEFWVDEITNMSNKNFYYSVQEVICGKKSENKVQYYKVYSPDKFFIEYFPLF